MCGGLRVGLGLLRLVRTLWSFGVYFLMAAPLPSDIIAPVWPLQLSCMACEASTHHLMHGMMSAERLSFMCRVP